MGTLHLSPLVAPSMLGLFRFLSFGEWIGHDRLEMDPQMLLLGYRTCGGWGSPPLTGTRAVRTRVTLSVWLPVVAMWLECQRQRECT